MSDDDFSILRLGMDLWDKATILWQDGLGGREPVEVAWKRIFNEPMPMHPQWEKRIVDWYCRYYGKGRLLVLGPTWVQIRLIPGASTRDNPAPPLQKWLHALGKAAFGPPRVPVIDKKSEK